MGTTTMNNDTRTKVFEALGVSTEIVDEKVELLQLWFEKKENSYEVPSKHMIELFLILNKCNVDASRKKLSTYYEIRPKIPELFRNKNPALTNMQKIANVVYFLSLPCLTPELHSVVLVRLKDTNPKNFDALDFGAHMFNMIELKLLSDRYAVGEIFLYDLEGITFSHFLSFGISVIRKISMVFEEVYSSRLKGIHYINCPTYTEAMISVVKTVLKPKLVKRIHIHSSYQTLFEYIPRKFLPRDYGGQEMSLEEMNEIQKMQFVKHKGRFEFLDKITEKMISKQTEEKKRENI